MPVQYKAMVTISTIKGYANGAYAVGWNLDEFTETLQYIEENNFKDSSISWLVTQGRAVYNKAYGAPNGGEDVFVLQADYIGYDGTMNIYDWKDNILNHAEYLRNYFNQSTVRVTFFNNVETTILR